MDRSQGPSQRAVTAWAWSVGLASVLFAILLGIGFATASYGYVLVIGTPFVTGLVVGRWSTTDRAARVVVVVAALAGVITAAVLWNLAGLVCGFTFGMIASLPLLLGVSIGARLMRTSPPSGSVACVALVALLIPIEQAAVPAAPVESGSTTHVAAMTPVDAFSRLEFYEDTTGTPPRLLRIALPRPIRTVAGGFEVGDRTRCLYDTGYIVKEVTAVEPGVLYAFRVIEQVGVEEHAVDLVDGSFTFEPVDARHTRITLTTGYRPKLSARLAWRPFEQAVIHALHRHVLRSMTRRR